MALNSTVYSIKKAYKDIYSLLALMVDRGQVGLTRQVTNRSTTSLALGLVRVEIEGIFMTQKHNNL
jgi:hypothetical protein